MVDSLTDVLRGLQKEIDNFIARMSNVFPQRREQIIFAINNYDVILSVMGVIKNTNKAEAVLVPNKSK